MNLFFRLMKLLFWLGFILMSYVYFLYPAVIIGMSRVIGKKFLKEEIEPPVTIIITAFNEENHIGHKIENTLKLDYPRDKMEIMIGSDGSTDKTNDMVLAYEEKGVRLMAFPQNRGKTMCQNDCVRKASHDIIIFMDASSLCEASCIRKLVSNFFDPRVGAVAGRVEFVQSMENLTTKSQGIYWKYEQLLKSAENKLGTLVGVDGPLYAIRKSLYVELEREIISDLITPLLVIRDGHSVVFEPEAVTFEEATKKPEDEFRTRKRIVTRGFLGLARNPELFRFPERPLIAWQIVSHKILRWLAGLYFMMMFISSFALIFDYLYFLIFSGMVTFLGLAYKGYRTQNQPKKIFAVPYYFALVNLAALAGFFDYIKGKQVVSWKPVR